MGWWAFRDSNSGPSGYEPLALTAALKALIRRSEADLNPLTTIMIWRTIALTHIKMCRGEVTPLRRVCNKEYHALAGEPNQLVEIYSGRKYVNKNS